jgi:hypothetical protein
MGEKNRAPAEDKSRVAFSRYSVLSAKEKRPPFGERFQVIPETSR